MRLAIYTALTVGLLAVSPALLGASALPEEARRMARQDLEVVDCALPSQMRVIGGRTYMSPRKPGRMTAGDCRKRGGDYVAFDRANLETALKVWLEAAEGGNPEAQTNVGEFYERGLGTSPDYTKAAGWYQKGADQGYSRALFNLGTLYEAGLGVGQDRLKALNLYRQAGGFTTDIGFEDVYQQELAKQREELQRGIEERNEEIEALQRQVDELERRLKEQANSADAAATAAREVATLRRVVEQLKAQRNSDSQVLGGLPPARTREPAATVPNVNSEPAATVRELSGLKLGRYYALVIGNQHYEKIEPLQTPLNDARRAAQLLESKYGFGVTVVNDADELTMMEALNRLHSLLGPEDNLLIYYAGHGSRLAGHSGQTGYWLPINSDPPPTITYWLQNEQITAQLDRLPPRRILVVADSCYAGLLSNDPNLLVLGSAGGVSLTYVKSRLPKRSRLLIASGGDHPVLDDGGQGNSIFARAFLDALESNQGVMSAPLLFKQLQLRVKVAAATSKFPQVPEFKAIKGAGHALGDFFFVPVTVQ